MDVATLETAGRALFPSLCRDTCTVKAPVAGTVDGFGGEAYTLSTVASGIRCIYKLVGDLSLSAVGGAPIGNARGTLFLELTDVDLESIGPGWQIIVAARGDKPALTFEDPRKLDGSVQVALTVSAKLRQ